MWPDAGATIPYTVAALTRLSPSHRRNADELIQLVATIDDGLAIAGRFYPWLRDPLEKEAAVSGGFLRIQPRYEGAISAGSRCC